MSIQLTTTSINTVVNQNIASFWTGLKDSYKPSSEDPRLVEMRPSEVLSLDIPAFPTAKKNKTYSLVKLVNRSNIGAQNVLVRASAEQLLQIGRAIAHLPFWDYAGVVEGYHNLSHKRIDRKIRVGKRDGSLIAQEQTEKGQWVMSRATSGMYTWSANGKTFVGGDVYKFFNRLRGGSWDATSKRVEWFADVPASERGTWLKETQAFMFNGELPARVRTVLAEQEAAWSKYHLVALMLQERSVCILRGDMRDEQILAVIHEGYIYEMWRLAGLRWEDRPARTNIPLTVSAEELEAIRDWEAYEAPSLAYVEQPEAVEIPAPVMCDICIEQPATESRFGLDLCHNCAVCEEQRDSEARADKIFDEIGSHLLGMFQEEKLGLL